MEKNEPVTEDVWIPTVCYTCNHGPDLLRVNRVNGVVVNIEGNLEGEGFAEYGRNHGRVCPKSYGQIQKLYNPHRIKSPLKRTNPKKGRGIDPQWVEISWEEALDTVAARMKEIRDRNTKLLAQGNPGPIQRTNQATYKAFYAAYGPTQTLTSGPGNKCELCLHVWGNVVHGCWSCEPDLDYCNYLLVLGRNAMASGGTAENQIYTDAMARGMKMVVLDPVLSPTAAKAVEWIPIKPGTDTAVLLALINTIASEIGVYDAEFLKRMTSSPYLVNSRGLFARDEHNKVLVWDPVDREAKPHDAPGIKDFALEGAFEVEGEKVQPAFQAMKEEFRQYSPEWAAGITEIPAAKIRQIAQDLVTNARIGSRITIDGIDLPYRPVSTKLGRGVTGVMRGYQLATADHILAALLGCLEAVGGHCGGRKDRQKGRDAFAHRGVNPGEDGMLAIEAYDFVWPPRSYDAHETLLPYSRMYGHVDALSYDHLLNPPPGLPLPPAPEMYVRYRCNPLTSMGEPEKVYRVLSQIPFIVSIAYVIDEVTELADIILPDHTDLERYELVTSVRRAVAKRHFAISLRQPVVERPLYNTMDLGDIFTELAERIGILDEYNEAVNESFLLDAPYRLEPGRKYEWREIVELHCKSVTAGEKDLEWFKAHGAVVKRVGAADQYGVHLAMVSGGFRYLIPYMEHVKVTGEKFAANLARAGIDWWPTEEYVPLPKYLPPVFESLPQEYDFYAITARSILHGWGANADIPWIIEVGEQSLDLGYAVMNRRAAAARGIEEGDEVWLENDVGRVKSKVRLREGIRPDVVLIAAQFGHYATPVARDTGRISLSSLTPMRHGWVDPMVGNMQATTVKVKIYKA